MKKILCYGDSNTGRTNNQQVTENEMRPAILANILGENYSIIVEAVGGRTVAGEDPYGRPGMNGSADFIPILEKHFPIDLLIWMLGPNQGKTLFNQTAQEITDLADIHHFQYLGEHKIPTIVVSMAPIDEIKATHYTGYNTKIDEVNNGFKKYSELRGLKFLDITNKLSLGEDGSHLDVNSHKIIAEELAAFISTSLAEK